MRLCIVGTGPAGFFLAGKIVRKAPETVINFVDASPFPFGLIRYGVAPDHPEVKVGDFEGERKRDLLGGLGVYSAF